MELVSRLRKERNGIFSNEENVSKGRIRLTRKSMNRRSTARLGLGPLQPTQANEAVVLPFPIIERKHARESKEPPLQTER